MIHKPWYCFGCEKNTPHEVVNEDGVGHSHFRELDIRTTYGKPVRAYVSTARCLVCKGRSDTGPTFVEVAQIQMHEVRLLIQELVDLRKRLDQIHAIANRNQTEAKP